MGLFKYHQDGSHDDEEGQIFGGGEADCILTRLRHDAAHLASMAASSLYFYLKYNADTMISRLARASRGVGFSLRDFVAPRFGG